MTTSHSQLILVVGWERLWRGEYVFRPLVHGKIRPDPHGRRAPRKSASENSRSPFVGCASGPGGGILISFDHRVFSLGKASLWDIGAAPKN